MSQQPPAATFDPALPTDLDRMRSALGDIDVTAPMFPDVTYEAKLVENGGAWRLAAAGMARDLAAQANAKMQSFSTGGDLAITWGNRSRGWLDIAVALERAHIDAESREKGGAGDVSFALPSRGDWDDAEYSNGLKGWR